MLIIACVAFVTTIYTNWVQGRFGGNFNSVEWYGNNKWRVELMFSLPQWCVAGPAFEELIFRAPLVCVFSAVTLHAWYGILVSSAIFALIHWPGHKIYMSDILSARKNGTHKSDNAVAELVRLYREKKKTVIARKLFQVVFVLPLGILAGYYGIKYHSIWVCFGIHATWNLVMPIVALPCVRLAKLIVGWG